MKKLYFLLVLLVMGASAARAQNNLNFQGKILNGGVPVNDNAALLQFTMPDFPSWSQNATVVVKNGLFAVVLTNLPNIFDSAHATRQLDVKYGGNPIGPFNILAPIERDPTVRGYIRDSVQWANIRSKPTIDTSNTNELQILSISKDTLRLSNGNYVILPRALDTLRNLTVNGRFTVLDTAMSVMTTIPFLGTSQTDLVYWQSFKATANGKLRELKINVASSTGSIKITVYGGIGTMNGPALGYQIFSVATGTSPGSYSAVMTGLSGASTNFISLTSGQLYTFKIEPASGTSTSTVSVLADGSNPYLDGISSITPSNPVYDIPFEIKIDNSAPSIFTIGKNGFVGVNVDTPSVQLEVKGRIKDQTGYIAPVGEVVAYAGDVAPEGWLLCDGTSVSRVTYADLFAKIGVKWGSGSSAGTFNIPDFRGLFLRGLDYSPTRGATGTDPEYTLRTAINIGGNTGNTVGSLQNDQLKSHTHTSPYPFLVTTAPNPYLKLGTAGANYSIEISSVNPTGGLETRPKNAAVNYIIKY